MNVFLVGKLINLVVVEGAEAVAKIMAFRNDPKLGCFIGRNFPFTTGKTIEDINGKDKVFLSIAQADEIIGFITLRSINLLNGTAKMTTFLGTEANLGKGIGMEAHELMLRYAFQTLNLRKVSTAIFAFNTRSIRCLEKSGFRREGVLEKEYYINGEYCDDILFRLFKEEWLDRNATLD
jgi:RimJ/RimL family protein N-acetyltransferase